MSTVSTAYRDTDGVLPNRVQLPTAPRSAQPVSIDSSKLPDKPPYTVYLGNIPFDISEEDITKFLNKCKVSDFNTYNLLNLTQSWSAAISTLCVILNVSFQLSLITSHPLTLLPPPLPPSCP